MSESNFSWRYFFRTGGPKLDIPKSVYRHSLRGYSQAWDPTSKTWVAIDDQNVEDMIHNGDMTLDDISSATAKAFGADISQTGF
jgi:hypothetical protein